MKSEVNTSIYEVYDTITVLKGGHNLSEYNTSVGNCGKDQQFCSKETKMYVTRFGTNTSYLDHNRDAKEY